MLPTATDLAWFDASGPDGLDSGFAHGHGGVAVPGARAVDGALLGGIDPALQLDLVGLTEALDEAGGDLAAPTTVGALDLQILIKPDDGAAGLADHLGADLVRDAGPDEDLVGDDRPEAVSKTTSIGSLVPSGAVSVASP